MKRIKKMAGGSIAGLTFAALIGCSSISGGIAFAAEEGAIAADEMVSDTLSDDGSKDIKDAVEGKESFEGAYVSMDEFDGNAQDRDTPVNDGSSKQSAGLSAEQESRSMETDLSLNDQGNSTLTDTITEDENTGKDQVKEGWYFEDGGYKYFKDGKAYTGWHRMGNAEGEKISHWSYFGKNGVIYTDWHKMGSNEGEKIPHWSYFGPDGWLRTNWQQLGKGTGNPDGNAEKHWSYFGANGWLRTGWQQLGKGTANPDGNAEKHWSYFGANGWLRTGLQNMGTASNPDGKSKQHLSYFGNNGWLVTSLPFTVNNVQYIADSKGWATRVQTEHEKVMARAMELVGKVTDDSMTKEQKLRACYIHIRDNYAEYNPRIPHYAGEGWHTTYANDIFINKGGNCISVAAAFAYMAAAIGYDNVYAVNGTGHGWAEVNNLIYDAEWERLHSGSFYALSYDKPIGNQDYRWIFRSTNPYARIKLS